jgi:hypothetical protein
MIRENTTACHWTLENTGRNRRSYLGKVASLPKPEFFDFLEHSSELRLITMFGAELGLTFPCRLDLAGKANEFVRMVSDLASTYSLGRQNFPESVHNL